MPSNRKTNFLEDYILIILVVLLALGGYFFLNRSAAPLQGGSDLPARAAVAPDVDLKVQDQAPGDKATTQGSDTLQSTLYTQGGAVNTTSPCDDDSTQLKMLQGGACTGQNKAEQLIK